MKALTTQLLAIMLFMLTVSGYAQTPKSEPLFSNLPSVINCNPAQFEEIFNSKAGTFSKLTLNNNAYFGGKVIMNEVKYHNLRTVAIQSPHFNNAVFSLSRQINDDNSISYTGRILKVGAPDGYEIKRDEKGNYFLSKFITVDIQPVCQ